MLTELVEILLIEDDPDDVELALHALRHHNCFNPVRVATDGEAALAAIFGASGSTPAVRPTMILLDLDLPKLEGLDVLRRIRADARTRDVPVVVVTSSRQQRDAVESHRLGVDGYIAKPVDFRQFAEIVARLGLYWAVIDGPPQATASGCVV